MSRKNFRPRQIKKRVDSKRSLSHSKFRDEDSKRRDEGIFFQPPKKETNIFRV